MPTAAPPPTRWSCWRPRCSSTRWPGRMYDIGIDRASAVLVHDAGTRDRICGMIEAEYALTREMVLRVSGGSDLAERFPLFRDRLKGRLPTINQVGREQVELLARYR